MLLFISIGLICSIANARVVPTSTSSCGCQNGSRIHIDTWDRIPIHSPGWPENYCSKLECHSLYSAPEGTFLRVKMYKLALGDDHLLLKGSDMEYAMFAGHHEHEFYWDSANSKIEAVFWSGAVHDEQHPRGFEGYITAIPTASFFEEDPSHEGSSHLILIAVSVIVTAALFCMLDLKEKLGRIVAMIT